MKDNYAHQYRRYDEWHWWFRGRRTFLKEAIGRHIEQESPIRFLLPGIETDSEIQLIEPFAQRYVSNIAGEQLEAFRSDVTGAVVESLTNLAWDDESMDCVGLFDVLEHIEDDEGVLKEVRRVLKNRGKLFVSVPAYSFLWSSHDELSSHKRRYTAGQLRSDLERQSFDILEWTYFNTLLFPPIAIVRLLKKLMPAFMVDSDSSDFDKNSPGVVNELLFQIFQLESTLIRWMRFRFGTSILVVAEKVE